MFRESLTSAWAWARSKSSAELADTDVAVLDDEGHTSDDSQPEIDPTDFIDRGSRIHPTLSMLESSNFDEIPAPVPSPEPTTPIVRKGWIEKCGNTFKTWKWRYFELTKDGYLRYYTSEDKSKCKGSIHVEATTKNDIVIQTHVSERLYIFVLITPHRNYLFSTKTQRAMNRWIRALESIGANARTGRWDPLRNTVHLTLDDVETAHKWTPYEDPRDNASMEGVLFKRGHLRTNWSKRFFRIENDKKDPVLRYYTEDNGTFKGMIPLIGSIVSCGLPLSPEGQRNYFVIVNNNQELHLSAFNEHEMYLWIYALQRIHYNHPRPPSVMTQAIERACQSAWNLERVPISFQNKRDFETIGMEQRAESLIVVEESTLFPEVVHGAQLITIAGVSLGQTCDAVRLRLANATYPLICEFMLPPKKRGLLVKKSRSTRHMTTWKPRDVVVDNGMLQYYNGNQQKGSFSLLGCWVNVAAFSNRPFCVVVGRSPTDKLVLMASSLEEQIEWASVLFCAIHMISQGLNGVQMRYEPGVVIGAVTSTIANVQRQILTFEMFSFLKKTKSNVGTHAEEVSDPPQDVLDAASHMPLLTYEVVYLSKDQVKIQVHRRRERKGEAVWLITASDQPEVLVGCQVYLVNGQRIPEGADGDTDLFKGAWTYPLRLTIILPPVKIGSLVKKSRSGRDKWDERIVQVRNGILKYFETINKKDMKEKGAMDLHRVKITYCATKERPYCIRLTKSSSDMLILSFPNDIERIEWAAAIYTASEIATRGISDCHAKQLALTQQTMIPEMPEDELGTAFHKAIPFEL
ncbi:hypothetical protein THRCLA_03926 [Thraustotheca clavata]|uniref:PH domain-containing protein n=1 Tax=Thraustotheca clavata TaxID=74557 RepID=A0A1W0A0R6_9STRA|nr:hypothetical protein THRCLA_03926 [Thraustotheca clavata]